MTDLFLEPKVLDYQTDRYELILLTLRWARAMKAKGSPEPMNDLIEKALRDIVEKKVTKEEIMANKMEMPKPVEEEIPAVMPIPEEGLKAAADEDVGGEKKAKKKTAKKKKD